MTKPKDLYRNACRRYHRIVANFLAVEAWRKGYDGVRIRDVEFKRMFDVDALKKVRLGWFRVDVADWFPVCKRETPSPKKGYTIRLMRNVTPHDGTPYDLEALPLLDLNQDLIPDYEESTFILRLQRYACGLNEESNAVFESKKASVKKVSKNKTGKKNKRIS